MKTSAAGLGARLAGENILQGSKEIVGRGASEQALQKPSLQQELKIQTLQSHQILQHAPTSLCYVGQRNVVQRNVTQEKQHFQTEEWEGQKRFDQPYQFKPPQNLLASKVIINAEEKTLSGPFRLKDGLFFSSHSIAGDTCFLEANKVSHVVAIDESPRRVPEEALERFLPDCTNMWTPRNLVLHWRRPDEFNNPVWR